MTAVSDLLRQRLRAAALAILGSLARRLLTIVGTALVARGITDRGTVDGIVPLAAELVAGMTLNLAATWWGVLRAYCSHIELARRLTALTAASSTGKVD